jgi:hypothetical protein
VKKIFKITLVLSLTIGLLVPAATVLADDYYSGDKVTTTGPNTLAWTGNGATDGVLNTVICDEENYPDGYLEWIFTPDGGSADNPQLTLGGTGDGTYFPSKILEKNYHFITPYITPDSNLEAIVSFDTTDTGNGAYILTITHGCPGNGGGPQASLTVTKTAETSYTRTHNWSIDKSVDTENGYTEDGYPKVWLYVDGSGDETATWTIDVTYDGYTDSDFNVSGDITITNDGEEDVEITGVVDELAGTVINIDWDDEITFPYTIVVGETITGTYSADVDSQIEGYNVATVNTDMTGDEGPITFEGIVEIVWGDPTTEVNKTVTIKDISDLFGEVTLGTVTADNATFTYTKDFAWADYGKDNCGDYIYENTATIVETEQSADATLLVNVQCYIYETAYAKGNPSTCFIPTFANWGWTNPINPGTYTWDLWAGAGQCDTSKGTLVGSVEVNYSGGYVTVTYNVNSPYILDETHVYAGTTMFPQVKQGKKLVDTVAPGQYYIGNPLSGDIYVIAHAKVGIPDPSFGP